MLAKEYQGNKEDKEIYDFCVQAIVCTPDSEDTKMILQVPLPGFLFFFCGVFVEICGFSCGWISRLRASFLSIERISA